VAKVKKTKSAKKPVKATTKKKPAAKKIGVAKPVVQPKPAPAKASVPITQEMIARRAKEIWEAKGKPIGQCMENWLQAEAELKARLK
jgi:hypothetical protein